MKTIVITDCRGLLTAAVIDGGRVSRILPEPPDNSLVGNIYTGRVKHIVPSIEAAFIEFAPGKTGYFSLRDNHRADLREGEELAVQVARDAVKTKEPVLSSNLSFAGRFTVLTSGRKNRAVSSKITDDGERKRLLQVLTEWMDEDFGVIARTEASSVPEEDIRRELEYLRGKAREVLEKAKTRRAGTLLREAEPEYIRLIRGNLRDTERIVTDRADCRENIVRFLLEEAPDRKEIFSFYEDETLPLSSLYRLDTALRDALSPKVWLKSGGYLVIEPTEALTVIDVNTGKFSGRKAMDEAILKVNMEAAEEAARQLTLRNLSGIILIDFINMRRPGDSERLMDHLRKVLQKDPVKTVLVDITALGLVEITRMKVERPLAENYIKNPVDNSGSSC